MHIYFFVDAESRNALRKIITKTSLKNKGRILHFTITYQKQALAIILRQPHRLQLNVFQNLLSSLILYIGNVRCNRDYHLIWSNKKQFAIATIPPTKLAFFSLRYKIHRHQQRFSFSYFVKNRVTQNVMQLFALPMNNHLLYEEKFKVIKHT